MLLAAGVALAVAAAAAAQDGPAPGSRFVCTALPPEAARAGCPLPAMPMQGGALSPEEELRAAVLQLRETVVQQKETLGAQREAIRELTGKLARCEGLAGGKAPGRAATGKDTMGDLPRDPGHVVEQLSRSLQTLKDRLESLEVAGCGDARWGGSEARGGDGARGPARQAVPATSELVLGSGGFSVGLQNSLAGLTSRPHRASCWTERVKRAPTPGLSAEWPVTSRGPGERTGTASSPFGEISPSPGAGRAPGGCAG